MSLMIHGYAGEVCPGRPLAGPNAVLRKLRQGGPNDPFYDHVVADGWPELYDLYGNVAEWVADWDALPCDPGYYFAPKTRQDPTGPATGTARVIRGGSYATAEGTHGGERRRAEPTQRFADVGFRCAADLATSQ